MHIILADILLIVDSHSHDCVNYGHRIIMFWSCKLLKSQLPPVKKYAQLLMLHRHAILEAYQLGIATGAVELMACAGNIMVVMEPPAQPLLAASYKLLSFLGKQNSPAAIDLLRPRLVLLDVGASGASLVHVTYQWNQTCLQTSHGLPLHSEIV